MPQLFGSARETPGLRTIGTLTAGAISVSKVARGDGEVVWRHPQHRVVLPLTGADVRRVTVQYDGGRAKEFVWHNGLGFYPAGTHARIVTTAATALQLLWAPDRETAGCLEPLLPFEDPLIATAAHAIARELDSGTPDRLFVESLGNALVIKLMRRFASPATVETPHPSGLSRERLRRLVEYIDAHLGDDLTLDALAAVACLSPFHLSRSFRRAMGTGLHRYVVQRRIDRARRLVLETDLPMAQIAWTVGFESQAAFTKRFRHEIGQAPSHLRRAN
jgi:AraC-like DNA-binding protein